MRYPPRISEEPVLTRWMNLEIEKINEGMVRDRKSLSALLQEKTPAQPQRKENSIASAGRSLPPLGRAPGRPAPQPQAPDTFFMTPDVPDSCRCMDKEPLEPPFSRGNQQPSHDTAGETPGIPGNCIRDPAGRPTRCPDCQDRTDNCPGDPVVITGYKPELSRAPESMPGALPAEKIAGVPEGQLLR